MTTATSPQPSSPSYFRITAENPPQFPCWIWVPSEDDWFRVDREYYSYFATHWHPDQPTAPTDTPTDSPAAPAAETPQRVPQEVDLEIGETVSGNINFNMIGGQSITVDKAFAARVRDRLNHLLGAPAPQAGADEVWFRAEEIVRQECSGLNAAARLNLLNRIRECVGSRPQAWEGALREAVKEAIATIENVWGNTMVLPAARKEQIELAMNMLRAALTAEPSMQSSAPKEEPK